MRDGGAALLAWLRAMRGAAHVCQDPRTGIWQVFRYQDVRQVMADTATFSSEVTRVVPDSRTSARGNVMLTDPPEHGRLRALVSLAFTPEAVAGLSSRIAVIAWDLLDDLRGRTDIDFVREFAYPLPLRVIAALLGLPASDTGMLRRWSEKQIAASPDRPDRPMDLAALRSVQAVRREFDAYLLNQVAERRAYPRQDLLTDLAHAELEGTRLTDREIVAFAGLLFLAGHLTTTVLLGNAMLCFAEYPHVLRALRRQPALLDGTIDEVLRYRSPFTQVGRLTTRDVLIGGVRVPRGQMVLAWILSANRDGRVIPRPDVFDPTRVPNPHIAFGHGVHSCLGAALARLTARIALPMALERFPVFRISSLARPTFYELGIFGPRSLRLDVRQT
ncbi:cytochrome P450 [Streptoalloteichus tenebrarius]|uniref:cytochrome P450 n=1 Tax=Streptoalloteichus tenebrarius (strain ATCC 17920 / DSM 40477 / JCM 4838 / CBS 697.72 / NBRC 16177 / NCIMB 11028 / NRRL B-12390 / A12253. 1 / ISP 5477) TaxID=1933 RepID=UPI0020A4EA01|nr:cytochrome P450 [Streptoalloteichus tenebrarius]